MVNPSKAAAAAPSTSSHGSKTHPVTSHSDFNPYGGKTKVMKPAPVTTTRADPPQPDIQSRAIPPPASTSARVMPPPASNFTPARVMPPPVSTPSPARVMPPPALTSTPARVMPPPAFNSTPAKRMPLPTSTSIPTKVETMPYEVNSYGGKTRMVTPSHTTPSPITTPDILTHTLVRSPSKASSPVPSQAPRPFRYSTPPSSNRVVASPPEPRPKSAVSKPSFRSQGITVQFSGRGATDESRREALRKLGLLKDTF
uniref:Uncharacterized protein n=2 Tax=Salmo trutta TaxID=8032 RepID=A0A673W5U1_SALTR